MIERLSKNVAPENTEKSEISDLRGNNMNCFPLDY